MTVYEAWATREDGTPEPVLCLETINVPIEIFDFAQIDLLHLFEAVAHNRGLGCRLVLITLWGTWNYANGSALRGCRVSRAGEWVALSPADPHTWAAYRSLLPYEAGQYTAFQCDYGGRSIDGARLLAPTDSERDGLQPENVAEALRLRGLPQKTLRPTAWAGETVIGFISEWPGEADG